MHLLPVKLHNDLHRCCSHMANAGFVMTWLNYVVPNHQRFWFLQGFPGDRFVSLLGAAVISCGVIDLTNFTQFSAVVIIKA